MLRAASEHKFHSEEVIIPDKIGSYLDIYDLEYPVIAMRYYFGDNPERHVNKFVDFIVLKDEECLDGFVGFCEPGCGVAYDFENADGRETINVVNSGFTRCKGALFDADEFKAVDEKTLVDEVAGITYMFDFTEDRVTHYPPFELYTAEKHIGSAAAARAEGNEMESPYTYV